MEETIQEQKLYEETRYKKCHVKIFLEFFEDLMQANIFKNKGDIFIMIPCSLHNEVSTTYALNIYRSILGRLQC